jgi:hypothetical protein
MPIAAILQLLLQAPSVVSLVESTINAMIAEGRTSTTADETAALTAAQVAQAAAEQQLANDALGA